MLLDELTGESVGLRGYDCATCSERSQRQRGCRLNGRRFSSAESISVDYHRPHRAPLDEVFFCPASIPGIWRLQADVFDLVEIRSQGGLREFYGLPSAALPEALVNLYAEVESAIERFSAEVRAASRPKKES